MKKVIKWGALAVVLIVVAAVVVTYLYLDSIVKYAVETQGTKQMNLKTELDGASVGLLRGKVGLDDLKIANPPGFTAPQMFTLDALNVQVPISQLRGNPKRISSITLEKPKLVIERSSDGSFNFKKAIEQMPKAPTGPSEPRSPQEPKPAGEEMKLIIDELTITGATVVVRPGLDIPGIAKEFVVPIPAVTMKNLGNADNAQNGEALRDVAQQVITVLAANASNSNLLPEQLRGLLSLDVHQVVAELGNRLGAEAQKRIAAAVPGELGQQLSKLAADPNAVMKKPNEAVDALKQNLGKEFGKNLPSSNPSDSSKAAEELKGLLGGVKDKKTKDKSAR